MEHISLAVRSVLARIANSGMIRLNAGEGYSGPATATSAVEEKGEKMRVIDADKLKSYFAPTLTGRTEYSADEILLTIMTIPTVEAEPTEEQVKEYCRKRSLVIVSNDLFNEMKARWSAKPVRHGRWVKGKYPLYSCSECGAIYQFIGYGYNYCPECGAKMDRERKT